MKKLVLLSFVFFFIFTLPVHAKTSWKGRLSPFHGFYAGIGYEYADFELTTKTEAYAGATSSTYKLNFDDEDTSSALIVGYGLTHAIVHLAMELEFLSSKAFFPEQTNPVTETLNMTIGNTSYKKYGELDVHIGLLPYRQWLIYAMGGVTLGKINVNFSDSNDLDTKGSLSGWRAGLGTEFSMPYRLRFRAEYSTAELGKKKKTHALTSTAGEKQTHDLEESTFRIAILYTL